nr:MAG TPA: hypothetical protein [Caudoviricetes sp.]
MRVNSNSISLSAEDKTRNRVFCKFVAILLLLLLSKTTKTLKINDKR